MRLRRAVALALPMLVVATVGVMGCGGPDLPRALARFQAGGVDVTLTLTAWDGTAGTITARFAPQQPGFHLYSVDLPEGGVDGLGVATRFAVDGDLGATGALTADEPVSSLAIAGLDVSVPVYPDGPVTTTVRVRRTHGAPASAVVSYAACSAGLCLVPVVDRRVPLAHV